VGHINPIRAWFDPRLSDFEKVYAAAGTPRHIVPVAPADILRLTGARVAEFTTD
jgi:prolyl-tRNA editing enzyme YbaK/EbsC (Cys-tRNA(Pro) deacylase)